MTLKNHIKSLACSQWLKDILTAAFSRIWFGYIQKSTINMLDMIDTGTSDGFKIFGVSDEKYRIKEGNSKLIENLAGKLSNPVKMKSMLTAITKKDGNYVLSFKD